MVTLAVPRAKKHANLTKSHRHAPKMEKAIAKRLGGVVVKGSGCGYEKADVRIKNVMRIEAKCTAKKSFTVTREMVEKIEAAALSCGELPAIEVEFIDEKGKPTHRLAIMPTYALEMVCTYKREVDPSVSVEKPRVDGASPVGPVVTRSVTGKPGTSGGGPRGTVWAGHAQTDDEAARQYSA